VGTTKHTINSVRDRSHWNIGTIKPVDPVSLGLCSQIDLDFAVQKAASRAKKPMGDAEAPRTLIPASEVEGTTAHRMAMELREAEEAANAPRKDEDLTADSVFAKLKGMKQEDQE